MSVSLERLSPERFVCVYDICGMIYALIMRSLALSEHDERVGRKFATTVEFLLDRWFLAK